MFKIFLHVSKCIDHLADLMFCLVILLILTMYKTTAQQFLIIIEFFFILSIVWMGILLTLGKPLKIPQLIAFLLLTKTLVVNGCT